MLQIIHNIQQISYSALMLVCRESIIHSGKQNYPGFSEAEQLIQAENDLYDYLTTMFQTDSKAICAVWVAEGSYKAILRLEEYRDGLLLNSLETAPEARRKGYGSLLVQNTLLQFPNINIYCHIHRNNKASIALHEKCGFCKIADSSLLLDGSFVRNYYTYCYHSHA